MATFKHRNHKRAHMSFAGMIHAPELQKVYLIAPTTGKPCEVPAQRLNVPLNGWLSMTHAEAVREYRKLNNQRNRVGRYCRVKVTLQGTSERAEQVVHYSGYVGNYGDVLRFKRKLRLRHNLPYTTFEVSTQYICG